MGIRGLHKILRLSNIDVVDMDNFKSIGIDASIWLHKFKYVDGSALGSNPNHDGWKEAFKAAFKKLGKTKKLTFVFDGKTPPYKMKEHEARRTNNELMKEPETRLYGRRLLVKMIEVSDLVSELKRVIDEMGWGFIDAEYEADQKLAQMSLGGDIDLVLTEDTDLVVYGCENILFKFNGKSGKLYNRSKHVSEMPFPDWEMFQRFCVMCGCDYLKLKGIAFVKALRICCNQEKFCSWEKTIETEAVRAEFERVVDIFKFPFKSIDCPRKTSSIYRENLCDIKKEEMDDKEQINSTNKDEIDIKTPELNKEASLDIGCN